MTMVVVESEVSVNGGAWTPDVERLGERRLRASLAGYADGDFVARRFRSRDLSDGSAPSAWSTPVTIVVAKAAAMPVASLASLPPMRGISGAEKATLASRHRVTHTRVEIQDEDGEWRDLSALNGEDFRASIRINDTPDQPVVSATLELWREIEQADGTVLSLAPLVEGSELNTRTSDATYAPFIRRGAGVRVTPATVAAGVEPEAGDDLGLFEGVLDDPAWSGAKLTVTARDLGARLQDRVIGEAVVYPEAPLAVAIQRLLADNGFGADSDTPVTLCVVGDPDWIVREYEQQAGQTVLAAIEAQVLQLGWTCRYEWTGRTTSQLTLYEPPRLDVSTATPVYTLTPSRYLDVTDFATESDGVRGRVVVWYHDEASGEVESAVAEDADTLARFPGSTMTLALDTASQIRTRARAEALAAIALSDVGAPFLRVQIDNLPLHALRRGDVVALSPNDTHHDTPQQLAVTALTHEITRGRSRTTVTLRGRHAGAYAAWLRREAPVVRAVPVVTRVAIELVGADEGTVTYKATATATRSGVPTGAVPDVRLVALSGGATLESGPAVGLAAPSGTLWTVTRPAGAPGEVTFGAVLAGAVGDTDHHIVPELGADVGAGFVTMRTEAVLVPGGTTATQVQVDVTATDPLYPGESVTITATNLPVGSTGPASVTGNSPLTQRYTIPRPGPTAGPARPRFTGSADGRADVLPDSDSVDVSPMAQALAFTQCNAVLSAQSATWVEYTVTATADLGSPTVELVSLSGPTTRLSGPAVGTPAASPQTWRLSRGAAGAGMGQALFRAVLAGYESDDEPALVPEQGQDVIVPLQLTVAPLSSSATQAVFRVTPTDPFPQGAGSVTITVEAVGCTVSPSTPQAVTSGAATDYTVTRPAAGTQTGSVLWTATASNRLQSTDGVQVPEQPPVISYVVTNAVLSAQSSSMIEYTVTATADSGTPTVTLLSVSGSAVRLSGPLPGVASPSGTVWQFTRGAAGAGPGQAVFRGAVTGSQPDDESAIIPEEGGATIIPLQLTAKPIASTATTVTVRVTPTDPLPQGADSISVAVATVGAVVTPTAVQAMTSGGSVDYTLTRPAFGSATGYANWTATAAGRLLSADQVSIPAQAPVLGFAECRARVTAVTTTSVTITVDGVAASGTPTVQLLAITGSAARTSGPAGGVASPSGTAWVFSRGAFGSGPGQAHFRATLAGVQSDDDLIVIPEQGRDTISLALTASVIATTATTVTVRVTPTDPIPQAPGSITLAVAATGCTVSPTADQAMTSAGTKDYTITRAAFGAGTGRVLWTATAANRVQDTDAVDVPNQDPVLGYAECRARMTAVTATTATVTVDGVSSSGTPTVALLAINGSAALSSGPAAGVASPSGTAWVFSRGAFGTGPGQAHFRATVAGLQSDDDLIVISEQGRDTIGMALRAQVTATTATTVTVAVTPTDPIPQGAGSITVTVAATGCTVTPTASQAMTSAGTVVYTITRPAFGAGTGRVLWTAGAAGRVTDTDAVDVPAQERDTVALTISITEVATTATYLDVQVTATDPTGGTAPALDTPTGATLATAGTSGATRTNVYRIARPTDNLPGRVTFTASKADRTSVTDSVDVLPYVYDMTTEVNIASYALSTAFVGHTTITLTVTNPPPTGLLHKAIMEVESNQDGAGEVTVHRWSGTSITSTVQVTTPSIYFGSAPFTATARIRVFSFCNGNMISYDDRVFRCKTQVAV